MQLTHPGALLWLLLAVPLIALYMLRIRRRQVPVSTILFWDQVFSDRRPRAVWRRLRHPLSLLLQLLMLGLLVLALTDPEWAWRTARGRRIVLVLDNSASMRATDVAPDRWTWAQRQSRRLIKSLRPTDQLAILSAGSPPRIEIGLTDHQRSLLKALDRLPVSDRPTAVAEAVSLAQRILDGQPQTQIVVVGDGQGRAGLAPKGASPVAWMTCGSDSGNVGITRWQVRRSPVDPRGVHALIEVANLSKQQVSCRLEVSLDEELIDVVPLRLKPDEIWHQVQDYVVDHGGRVTAQLNVRDALACDNQAVALLPDRAPQAVMLVTNGNRFLESALRALPNVELTVRDAVPPVVASDTILICHKQKPPTGGLPSRLFFIDSPIGEEFSWGTPGEPLGETLVVDQASESVLMSHVQLLHVSVSGVRQLQLGDDFQVLAEAPGQVPVLAAQTGPQGKMLIWNLSLDQGELPLRTAFPILLSNAIQWFQGNAAPWSEAYATGSLVTISRGESTETRDSSRDPSSFHNCRLVSPDQQTRVLSSTAEKWIVGPLNRCGVWRIVGQEPQSDSAQAELASTQILREIACNLVNREESDLRGAAPVNEFAQVAGTGGAPLWWFLVLAGLIGTSAEWFLYQRRWIA